MNISDIIIHAREGVYATQLVIGLFGVYLLIVMFRQLSRKRFSSQAAASRFLDQVGEKLQQRDIDGVAELCDSPTYWSKAVPQLIVVALQNPHLSPAKLRRHLGETFEREVLADFDFRSSWIVTIVRAAPMLGLLGTVMALIAAFEKIATIQTQGTDPSALAGDIGHALLTTAFGLAIAIPLTLAGNLIHVRLGMLQNAVQHQLGTFLEMYEAAFRPAKGKSV
ncbi:MAG TPA: MotA/TolQ/ExbB proton channel family protein [Planctomycetaceae bacterium]|jgi:biopolymer transport protein ExbB/TolQ|nr:MotA/TolQ/ExbB proton channel family protein [Planctomycetaceae bacterium]